LWPISFPPNISQSANPWKDSLRLVIAVICSGSSGSDRKRSSVIVRTARPSSVNARYSRFFRE
jgi:hypothetical protein